MPHLERLIKSNFSKKIFFGFFSLVFLFGFSYEANAVAGVPEIISHQGRLLDSSGNLLGGSSGTNYCFRFSFYDDATVGGGDTKLWPAGSPSTMTVNVKSGVFNVGIGDTSAGGDTLDFNFQDNDSVYLNTEVAAQVAGSCAGVSFENLSPRQRINSSGFAINASTVGGFTPSQSADGNDIVALTSDDLILGGTNPEIAASGTNTLTLQGAGATGNLQFFSNANTIDSFGNLDVAGTLQSGSSNVALTLATGFIDADAITLAGSGSSGATSSASGLETSSDGLTLLRGCANNEILKWNDVGGTWSCATDSSGGGGGSLDDAYNNGSSVTVDASNISFNLSDATNDYNFVINNSTTGAIASALSVTTTGVGSSFLTALDLSDADIDTAIALGSNDVTVGGLTISSTEFGRLDSIDAALIDLNDAVATAITGTGALNAGSITSGFGAIDLGADNFTTTGIVSTDTLTLTGTGTLNGLDSIDATGETTLESTLDIAGDVTGTGLTAVVIADNAVDGTDIALGSDAQGDIMYYNGTDWVRLGAGNSGEFLQTNGTGANPSWAAAASGDITAVGDVASGAAFNGSAGTTLTFDDTDGDQTFAYDTTNNEFDISDDVNITGTLVASGGLSIDATTESNIESAVDIAGDVDGTGLGSVDIDEVAVEAELESVIDLADLQGAVTDAQVPNSITIDLATLATTASALSANGANCSAGSAAGGVSATGAAEDCTDYEEDLSNSAGLIAALSDETGTGLAVFNDSPTFADDFNLGAAGVRATGADGVITFLGLGNGNDEDLSIDFDNATANTISFTSSTGVNALTFGAIALSTDTLTLTGTGTLNGLDSIDATGETTLESTLDIAGDVTGTGLTAVVIADNAVDGTDIALGSDAQGDIMYYNGTDWVRLGAGNSGEFLQTNGTGANPSWAAAASGDITAVGDVASGAAFNGSAGTTLTFDDTDGDQTFAYDTTNNEFDISDDVNITGTLVASGGLSIDATTESNIESAVDIAGDVDGTGLGSVDIDEVAVEAELESVIDLADLQGAVTDAQVPNSITIDLATLATTASALSANGANCSAGSAAGGVSATGAAEDCTDYEEDLSNSAGLIAALSDETGTGLAVFNDSPTFADDFNLGAAGVRATGADGVITFLGLGNGNDEDLSIDFDNATANTISFTSSTGVNALTFGAIALSTDTLTLTGTGTLNGLDSIDATGETTLESTLDIAGDVTGTGLTAVVIADNAVDGTDIALGSDAQGDIMYYNGTDWVRLGAGNSGEFLQTNGTGANPSWAAAASGDITAVGDVASGAAFNGSAGTTLTFDDTDGDQTFAYDTTNNEFDISDDVNITGTLVASGGLSIDATTESNIESAVDIAGDVDGTGLGSVDIDEVAVEAELESVIDLADLQGAVTDAQVPNSITIDLATLATTASALSANGANCSAGSAAGGVSATGAAEDCTDYEEDLSNSAGLIAALSDETGTGLAVFNDSPTFADDFNLGAAGVRATGADGVITFLGLGNGNDEDLSIDFDNATANTISFTSSTGVNALTFGAIALSTDTLTLTGTGTLNGLDSIDATGETTLESTLDIAGDVTGTGLTAVVIADNAVDGTDIALGSDAQGDIMYYNGTDWVRLGAGNSGEFLQTNGTGANPSWAAAASGDITAVGDVASGAAFNGSAGTTLTFDDTDGDQTFAYDTTNNEFDISDDVNITGTLVASGGLSIDATTESNIESAVDIAGDVDGTGLGSVDIDEVAVEAELESVIDLADLQGAVTDAQVPNSITIDLATLATTASALSANGANCSAGSAAGGVSATGAAEDCTDYEEDLSNSAGLIAALSDETGTGLAVFNDSPTFADDFNLGAAGVRATGADGVITFLGLGNGNDEDLSIDFDNATANTISFTSSTGVNALTFGAIALSTDTLTLTGTGTLNGLDSIDATGETTLESTLDIAGDVTGTGLTAVVIADNAVDGTDIALGSDAQGDIMYYNGTDWVRLGAGNSGEFLQTNGTGANPSWAAAASGDITAVGDVASGAAFNGSAGTTLTFDDTDGDQTFAYDTTNNEFDISDDVNITGTLVASGGLSIDATTESNIESAVDIAGDVDGTGLGSVDIDEVAVEAELESVIDLADLQGAVTDAQVPNSITIDLATLATTASALSANGANCSAGSAAGGVSATGAAEDCTDYEEDLSNSAGLIAALSDETGTGLAVFNDSPTFADDFNLGAAGVRATGADGVITFLGLGNGNDEDLSIDFDNATANTISFTSSTGVNALTFGAIALSTDTLTLTGTGTLNGLDSIDATGETTLESTLDIAGDVTGTGLTAVVIADNAVDGTDIALGSDAQGDIMYYNGTDWVRLGAGNSGEFLQTNGTGANPSWAAAASGDITAVGDVASGAAFNGSAGTTLTFDDTDGDQTFAYDTTNNEFDISDDVNITGTLVASGGLSIDATTESNIESAVDIAGDVDGTGLGSVDIDEVAVEAELESVIDLADLQGAVTDAQVPNSITIDLATSASDLTCTDCINATEIEDIYVLNGGDTITGALTINDNNGSGSTLVTIGDANDADSLAVFGDITISGGDITLGTSSILSGGDTASLNNIDAVDATTEATIESAIDALTNLVTTGTLTGGATGAGFTLNFSASTLSGSIGTANISGLDISDDTNLTAGDGTVLTGDDVAVDLKTATENGVGTASSASGLEFESGQLTLLQGCADNEILKWDETEDDWNCEADATGGGLSDADYGDITVSSSGTVWTIDADSVALGTDTTGNYVSSATALGGLTLTGTEGASLGFDYSTALSGNVGLGANATIFGASGMVVEGATADDIETFIAFTDPTSSDKTITFPDATITVNAAADISGTTLASNVVTSSLTTVGALNSGSIASGFGAIDTGADNITTTGTVSGNSFDRSSTGAIAFGNTTATSVSLCNSTNCDTITIGTTTDNDTITIGEATDTNVSITDNNWSISVAGLITTNGGLSVTAGDVALADTTGTTWSITNAGVATFGASVGIGGTSDGTDALTITQGDILLSDGDLDVSSGDFNVVLDSSDGVNIKTGSPTVDVFTIDADSPATDGVDGLSILMTATNQTNFTNSLINGSLTAQGTASGDIARGLFLDLLAQAGGTEKAIEIENTAAWDVDIELQNDETISNLTDGTIDFSGALEAGSSNVTLTLGTGFIDADAITLFSGGNGVGITTSSTGLETESDGLTLLQGCNDAQILKWEEDTDTWDCALDSSGGLSDLDYGDITVSSSGSAWDIDILASADGLSATVSNGSGLESLSSGLGLLQGCSDGQILKWTESSDTWGCAADNSGGSITSDSLDFTELSNAMSVDEATEINLGANAFTIDMDSTGDFSIRDGATDIAAFSDSGVITFTPTAGSDFILNMAAGTNFQANASAAPTVDLIALTNTGFGTTTSGVDGVSINFETGDGSSNTNSALDISLINGGTSSGDVIRGITLNDITPSSGTETGLYIGTGFDYDIQFGDTSAVIQLADRGTLSIVDGSSGVGTLLAVGSATSRGDLDVYGNLVKKGYVDQTALTTIRDVFVYDTAKDTDGGAWVNSNTSQNNSWYTETKDDGAGDLCVTATDDRCGTSSFPKKAILVATESSLYIFDAHSSNLWMKFTQDGTYALGADTNNNPSSVFAQNGTIYVGTNGSSGTGLYEFDFPGDKMFRYNTTGMSQADVAISGRNSTVTYNVNSKTNMALNSNLVNDVHATTIQGGSNVLTNGGPLNGVRFIAAGTDDGISVVNTASQVTYDFGNGAITDNYQSVFLTKRGRLFGLNSTDTSVDRFGLITTSANTIDTAQANVTTVSKAFNATTRPASLWKSAPTFATNAPDALEVSEQASLAEVDTVATGRGDVLYVAHSLGLTEIHDTNGVSSATVQPWSKFYTTSMQTDYMPATNKGMYTFEDTTGDLTDAALTNNVLEPENAPTYRVNGVRGYGLRFNGSSNFLCSDVNNDGACDVETDFASTTTAFNVSFWFKTNGTVSTVQTLVDKSTTTAAGAAATGWRIWLTNSGQVAFAIDDDTTFTPDDVATSTEDFDDSQWHHVYAQRTNAAGRLDLFVDGRLVGNDTTISATLTLETTAAVLSVGARCNVIAACTTAQEFFNGDMDDLVFTMGGATTTDTLNQAQVRKIYLAGLEAMKHKTISVDNATSATSTTIADSGESWTPNEFVGQIVEITGGTGAGQTRRVTSNTTTELTVSPAWSSTPSTDSDFVIEPEFLYGSTDVVRSVAATTEQFLGRSQTLYVGTDDGSDGGGMTVFSGFGNTLLTDVYHSDSEKTDNSNSEWTGADYDDMQAIDLKSGILVSASDAGLWVEMPDTDVQQSIDSIWANITTMRAELIADAMQASGLEYGAVGSADLAEYYYSNEFLEPGEVVAIQPDQPAGIGKSSSKYQKNLLGVVSTQPALTMGASAENAYAIALAGRIPVKITDENGIVRVGDELTASSRPGYAMKATKAGAVLGRVINEPEAMASCEASNPVTMAESIGEGPGVESNGGLPEEVNWTDPDWQASDNEDDNSNISEPDPEDPMCGYAMVFIGLSDSLGKNINELKDEFVESDNYNGAISVDDPIKDQKEILAFLNFTNSSYGYEEDLQSIFTDRMAAAVDIIAPSIYANGLTVDSISSLGDAISFMNDVVFIGRPYFNSDTAGFAVILQGARKIDVTFTTPYLTQPVVNAELSFETLEEEVQDFTQEESLFNAGINYLVTRKSVNGFTILLNKPAPYDLKFSWVALAVQNANTFTSTEADIFGVETEVPVEEIQEEITDEILEGTGDDTQNEEAPETDNSQTGDTNEETSDFVIEQGGTDTENEINSNENINLDENLEGEDQENTDNIETSQDPNSESEGGSDQNSGFDTQTEPVI